jgi:hypothetical protein
MDDGPTITITTTTNTHTTINRSAPTKQVAERVHVRVHGQGQHEL